MGEGIASDAGHALRNRHARQSIAVVKHIVADAGYALGNCHILQSAARIEGLVVDLGHTGRNRIRGAGFLGRILNQLSFCFIEQNTILAAVICIACHNVNSSQVVAVIERFGADIAHAGRNRYVCHAIAVAECIVANFGHIARNHHIRQRAAPKKCHVSDLSQAFRELHARQSVAGNKRTFADAGHAFGNRHALQRIAVAERIVADAHHVFRNIDLSKIAAVIERTHADSRQALRQIDGSDFIVEEAPGGAVVKELLQGDIIQVHIPNEVVFHRAAAFHGQNAGVRVKIPGQIAPVPFRTAGAGVRVIRVERIFLFCMGRENELRQQVAEHH